jgi:hypothetical protein
MEITGTRFARLIGGPGNDSAVLPGQLIDAVVDGGDGADSLTWKAAEIFVNGIDSEDYVTIGPSDIRHTWGQITHKSVEDVTLNGGRGNDLFVLGRMPAGVTVRANGAGGVDTFELPASASGATAPSFMGGDVVIDGGDGADTVTVTDNTAGATSAVRPGNTFTVTPTGISVAAPDSGRLTFAGVETVSLLCTNGPDTVRVTPSATTVFRLTAGGPNGPVLPNDLLEVVPAGATGARRFGSSYEFSNRKRIDFSGFERFNDAIAPRPTLVGFDRAAGTLYVGFNEAIAPASLGTADVAVRNLTTGTDVPVTGFSYDPALPNGVRFTLGDLPAGNYQVTVLSGAVTDVAGNPNEGASTFDFAVAGIAGRWLFYNNSAFDGYAHADDTAAVATDKSALLPGAAGALAAATAANISGYSRGLNGVMIDAYGLLVGMPFGPSPTDFEFRVGAGGDPATWDLAPDPAVVWFVQGGVAGSTRIAIVWADGAIVNKWLRVTVKAGPRTGLLADDVFYFGHLLGDGADPGSPSAVRAADVMRTRLAMGRGPSGVTNGADVNKDGKVNALYLAIVRRAAGTTLRPIAPPPPQAAISRADNPDHNLDDLLL